MDISDLDRIEAQWVTRLMIPIDLDEPFFIYLLRRKFLRPLCYVVGFIQAGGEGTTPPTEDTEFLINIRLPDLFDLPSVYEPMSPEIYSAVSAGKNLGSYDRLFACLQSNHGDSILHLAASRGRLAKVKSIVSEYPCLLLALNSRGQFPLHVAASAGYLAIVKALVATVTFVSATLSEEERERLNLYVVKDSKGDTPLHLALKNGHMMTAAFLVSTNNQASFLADLDRKSPLYLAVEAGEVSLVRDMLLYHDVESQLEGRKYLVHAALKARSTDILDVILEKYPILEDELDEEGMTCLSFGASIGFYAGISNLLNRSTKSVYVCNKDGSFPIHIAVEKRHMNIVNVIRRRCPDSIYLLNIKAQNILHIASKIGNVSGSFLSYFGTTQLMVQQDKDGNTPLHLATINWRPRTIYFLLANIKPKWRSTRNNCGSTPLTIAKSTLKPNYIFMERVTLMVLLHFEAFCSKDLSILSYFKKITIRSDPPAGDKNKDYVSTLLVVAALVATVTFAAGFTIPGGFNSSGPNLGSATLASERKLVCFMVFDILAMQSSIITIATLIWAKLGDPSLVHRSINVALPSLFFALLCMSAAFYFGVFVAFSHIKGLVIFLNITFAIFIFLMLFVLAPHVILQIPGIPAFLGLYFVVFVLLVDENSHGKGYDVKISESTFIRGVHHFCARIHQKITVEFMHERIMPGVEFLHGRIMRSRIMRSRIMPGVEFLLGRIMRSRIMRSRIMPRVEFLHGRIMRSRIVQMYATHPSRSEQ